MDLKLTDQELAKNLRKPEGKNGLIVAGFMSKNNANFYQQLYENVEWKDNMRILEVGCGSGMHIKEIKSRAANINYVGVDYSQTMINECMRINPDVEFYHQDILKLNLPKGSLFDLIVTINTVYFIDDLRLMMRNLKSYLVEGGELHVGKRPKEDLDQLNHITQYNFNRYSNGEVAAALMEEGLDVCCLTSFKDNVLNREGNITQLHSDFIVAINQ